MITQDEAIAIARVRALENGWALPEPVSVRLRRDWSGKMKSYVIESNPVLRGSRSRFEVDAATGKVVDEGYIPR